MNKNDDKERKLSKAELKRQAEFEEVKEQLLSEGYEMKEHTLGIIYANVMALVIALPLMLPFIAAYIITKGGYIMEDGDLGLFLIFSLIFVILHEAVHGVTWGCFAKNHFKSISFGFMTEMLTPYCNCSEPLKKWQYMLGSLMPLFVVGFVPSVIAVFVGKLWLFLCALVMIMGAGGDIIVTHRMVRYKPEKQEVVYYDHPTKCGFITFER